MRDKEHGGMKSDQFLCGHVFQGLQAESDSGDPSPSHPLDVRPQAGEFGAADAAAVQGGDMLEQAAPRCAPVATQDVSTPRSVLYPSSMWKRE